MRPREGEVDYLPAARGRAAQLQATASDQTLDQSDNRLHSRVGASPLPSDRHARRTTPRLRPTTLNPSRVQHIRAVRLASVAYRIWRSGFSDLRRRPSPGEAARTHP